MFWCFRICIWFSFVMLCYNFCAVILRPHCNFSFEIIKFTLPYLTLGQYYWSIWATCRSVFSCSNCTGCSCGFVINIVMTWYCHCFQPHQWITVDDYDGEEGDLSFKKGEIITILETRHELNYFLMSFFVWEGRWGGGGRGGTGGTFWIVCLLVHLEER